MPSLKAWPGRACRDDAASPGCDPSIAKLWIPARRRPGCRRWVQCARRPQPRRGRTAARPGGARTDDRREKSSSESTRTATVTERPWPHFVLPAGVKRNSLPFGSARGPSGARANSLDQSTAGAEVCRSRHVRHRSGAARGDRNASLEKRQHGSWAAIRQTTAPDSSSAGLSPPCFAFLPVKMRHRCA